jgi:organic hydroperoxide reductase OsmC/OhrA
MDETGFRVEVALSGGYEMRVDFGLPGVDEMTVDEPPPLGAGAGPNPARLLAAAVGSCMSASLLYCLRRAHLDAPELRTRVEGTLVRNERGRMRIGGLKVTLMPGMDAGDAARAARCVELFEDFCIVGQSVRAGIPLDVVVQMAELTAETGGPAPAAAAA